MASKVTAEVKDGVLCSITITSDGPAYAGELGGTISPYREEQLEKIAEQIWIAVNPSHGDFEYASRREFYLELARESVEKAIK